MYGSSTDIVMHDLKQNGVGDGRGIGFKPKLESATLSKINCIDLFILSYNIDISVSLSALIIFVRTSLVPYNFIQCILCVGCRSLQAARIWSQSTQTPMVRYRCPMFDVTMYRGGSHHS